MPSSAMFIRKRRLCISEGSKNSTSAASLWIAQVAHCFQQLNGCPEWQLTLTLYFTDIYILLQCQPCNVCMDAQLLASCLRFKSPLIPRFSMRSSRKLGLTMISPVAVMTTRCPGRLYRVTNLGVVGTVSCKKTNRLKIVEGKSYYQLGRTNKDLT